MPSCHICGATNCKLYVSSQYCDGHKEYICSDCKAKEAKIKAGIDNAKKGVMAFLLLKVVPFFFPLIVGISAAYSVKGIIDYVALIIVFAVVSALLWIGAFVLGNKSPNRFAQMGCRFIRRVCFGAATGFALLACEMLGLIQPVDSGAPAQQVAPATTEEAS